MAKWLGWSVEPIIKKKSNRSMRRVRVSNAAIVGRKGSQWIIKRGKFKGRKPT